MVFEKLSQLKKSIFLPLKGTNPLRLNLMFRGKETAVLTASGQTHSQSYKLIRQSLDLCFCTLIGLLFVIYHLTLTLLVFTLSGFHIVSQELARFFTRQSQIKQIGIIGSTFTIGILVFVYTSSKEEIKTTQSRGYQNTFLVDQPFILYKKKPNPDSINSIIKKFSAPTI